MALRDRLPAPARRRLARIRRALLDQPEPAPPPGRRKPRPRPRGPRPVGVAPPSASRLPRLEQRRAAVLQGRASDCSVLEIGPAHNAVLAKRDGYRTRTVDHLDRAGLVAKYRDDRGVDVDLIEEVDYVVSPGAPLADVIPERFDVVVASHVLEHTTSVVDFLQDCARLLNPTGHVALVVPDYRFCFDRFRERSSLGRVIDAAEQRREAHSVGTVLEFSLQAVTRGRRIAWAPGQGGPYRAMYDLDTVRAQAAEARAQDRYIDVHNWVFSPHHLRLLLHDLATLGYLELWESSFHPTIQHEFFLNLSPTGPGAGMPRHELARLADAELRTLDRPRWRTT